MNSFLSPLVTTQIRTAKVETLGPSRAEESEKWEMVVEVEKRYSWASGTALVQSKQKAEGFGISNW